MESSWLFVQILMGVTGVWTLVTLLVIIGFEVRRPYRRRKRDARHFAVNEQNDQE